MADFQFEVEKIEDVEEEIREAYVEKDGKFRLDPDKYHELRAKPLIAKNKEVIGVNKKLADQLKATEKAKIGAADDVEKIVQQRDSEIADLKRKNREYSIWMPVQQLALANGALKDRIGDFMKILRADGRFDLDSEDKLVFNDKDGDVTIIKPSRAFEYHLREEFPWAFEASKAGGSGAKNGNKTGATRTIPRETFDGMSPGQQDQAIKDGARIVD